MATSSIAYETEPGDLSPVIDRFLSSLSSLDVDLVLTQITEDAELSVSNELYALGKHRIRKALVRAISALTVLDCEPAVIWTKDNLIVIEADVSCVRMDGFRGVFPVTAILRLRGQRISHLRVFTYQPAVMGSFLWLNRSTMGLFAQP